MSVNGPNSPAERPTDQHPNKLSVRRRWRYFSRRHAIWAGLIIGVGAAFVLLLLFLSYRLGFVDRYIANQITNTFANYGIRAEIKTFHASFPPQTVEMNDVQLFDQQTGERLGKIDRLLATIRIEDLYALNLRRNINLKDLKIEGFETWVTFNEQGLSNFRNIHIPPPEPNKRILFAYSTAHVEVKNGLVHYGDAVHKISGEARNLQASIEPDDPNAPADSWMNTVALSLSNSTFTYDDRPFNDIGIQARARVNQTRAEIQELALKSPVVEAHLEGIMDDWRALHYQMNVTSSVDLTLLSETLKTEKALRGSGNFAGTVSGEGEHFRVEGGIKSDALAADNIRLKGLTITASGSGQGKSYNINGKAVAELLTAGDFQIDALQLAGNVMGTGTDFRWVGELRAVAEKSYGTTLTGLILHDARAEVKDGALSASASQFTSNGVTTSSAKVSGLTASDLRVQSQNNVTTGSIKSVKAGNISLSGGQIKGVTANDVSVVDRDGVTNVQVQQVQVGATSASGAEIGNLNIAGVRLSVRNQKIEGSTADIDAGTVKVADGHVDNVKLAKPVFVVEPSGSYRASADLSLGGGVLGQMNMGRAQANLVATNREIQLNNFNADIFKGSATGNAQIAVARGGNSHIVADFNGIEIAGPLTALAGSAVPLSGRTTGRIDLTFPGTDYKQASGTLTSQVVGDASEATSERIPLTGDVMVRAYHGMFDLQRVNLQTPATHLQATGQFSFEGDSNLQVALNSSNAAELQSVFIDSGLLPEAGEQLSTYGIGFAGQLAFNGTVRGKLNSPDINGNVSLGSLLVNGNEVGSLSAAITMTPSEIRVADGRLSEPDGGGVQFSLVAPRSGQNNITVEATLNSMNAETLITALPLSPEIRDQLANTQSQVSGHVKIAGIPDEMSGSADLRFSPGKLAGEPLESMVARATFSGSNVNVESVDARLAAGHLVGSATFNTTTKSLEFQGKAEGIQLARLAGLINTQGLQSVTGIADLTVHFIGNLKDKDFSGYVLDFEGQARDVIVNGRNAGTIALIGKTQDKQLNVTLTTGILGQPQVVTARVNLASERLPATIETTLSNADLTNLLSLFLPPSAVAISGRANGTIQAAGDLLDEDGYFSIAGLSGTASFSELGFRIEDIALNATTPLVVHFTPSEVTFNSARFTGPGTNISLDGTLATSATGKQNLNVNGSLNLRVLNGVSPDFFSSGTAEVAMRISGSFEQPRLIGTADVANGSVSVLLGNERWTITNLKTTIRFTSNQAQIDSFVGNLGGGRLEVSGGALLEGFTVSGFRLSTHAENVNVPFPEGFRSLLDADVEIKGTSHEQLISGLVNLRRTEYTEDIELADLINSRRAQSLEEGSEIEFVRTALFAGLRVEGRNALVVRNNLADLVGSVSLQLNGPVRDPVISGRITATSGTLNFRNDRYDITRALMDLPPARNADPVLNIQGESQIRGYRVIVSLTGPLSQPSAIVRSEPALPQADVVSLITTGQLASADTSASVLSQSGLGTATSLLTDALINAPAQRATSKLFGLSRFEINPVISGYGSAPAARLTLGKRISKEVTVTYSTNVATDPNQILALEYRLSDRLSFVAQYEQASTRRLTARNNSFSFEIRFRKRF